MTMPAFLYKTPHDAVIRFLSLSQNHDVDEEGSYFRFERFKDNPVILTIREYERTPNIMDIIAGIPDLDAELLERQEEKEIDIKRRR